MRFIEYTWKSKCYGWCHVDFGMFQDLPYLDVNNEEYVSILKNAFFDKFQNAHDYSSCCG